MRGNIALELISKMVLNFFYLDKERVMPVLKFKHLEDADNELKIKGRMRKYKKGFTEELNEFFHLILEFKKDKTFLPRGVFRFETFEEAEKWRLKMLRGKSPDRRQ